MEGAPDPPLPSQAQGGSAAGALMQLLYNTSPPIYFTIQLTN